MKKGFFYLFIAAGVVLSSCSNDENLSSDTKPNETGRFDYEPFKWDVIKTSAPKDAMYVGDIIIPETNSQISTRLNQDDLIVSAPTGLYIGAVYPLNSINNYLFDNELMGARNPIDLIFEFNDPYFGTVQNETGSIGYQKALKNAVKSPEYADHVLNKTNLSTDYFLTQYYNLSDLEKIFNGNTGLFNIFSAKVQYNSKKTKINSKLVARLINVNFSAYMDMPIGGIFKDPEYVNSLNISSRPGRTSSGNSILSNYAYTRSISYGKVVYLSIESEYSYSEVKSVIETSISLSFGNLGGNLTVKQKEILSKSSLTIMVLSDSSTQSYFMDGLENLHDLFNAQYTNSVYGRPIYIQMRHLDNKSYTPPTSSSNSSGRTPDRTPDRSSGRTPGNSSGTSSGTSSGRTPDRSSGRTPGNSSGTSSGTSSGRTPDRSSGRTPGNSSGTSSGTSSGRS